jgi:hypothetical protein
MAELEAILEALRAPRLLLHEAVRSVPALAGLYAIYGDGRSWAELRLSPVADRPLYVGKAEDSLAARDLRTHFADGRTGRSTVRRSFAALLRDELSLRAIPRNPAKREHFDKYGLSPSDDAKLTAWMRERLQIAVWLADGECRLGDLETAVLQRWNPPINLAKVAHPWKAGLQARRKAMADDARAWRPDASS